MTDTVNIAGLDRVELLKQLWLGSKPAAFFKMSMMIPPPFDEEIAKTLFIDNDARDWDIDYFAGRAIKTDLKPDEVNPYFYNRLNGAGVFEKIVEKMRKE